MSMLERKKGRERKWDRERESVRGQQYAEHIWAAKLSALLNNLVPLADWLTDWLAG